MSDIVKRTVLTEDGQAYLAKQYAGQVPKPEITRAMAGEGFVPWDELEQQSIVTDPVAQMQMDEPQILDSKYVKIPLRLMNNYLETSVHIRQIGIYAMDPDKGEILYQLMQFATPREVLSLAANDGESYVYNLNHKVTFANTENIKVNSDPEFWVVRGEFDELKDRFEKHTVDPEAHQDIRSELANKLSDITWEDINGRPATFPPTAHNHTKNQITDFPTNMPPAAHTHAVADITGTLPINKGGTNATTAAAALTSLGAAAANHSHSNATTSAAGFLTAADKLKIDKCPADTNAALANKANVGSPAQTSLNPSSGVTGAIVYYKNEFNQVIVIFDCSSSSSSGVPNRTIFVTMPSGYRARTKFSTPIVMQTVDGNTTQFGFVDVQTNGSIVLDTTANSAYATRWFGTVTYYTT